MSEKRSVICDVCGNEKQPLEGISIFTSLISPTFTVIIKGKVYNKVPPLDFCSMECFWDYFSDLYDKQERDFYWAGE